MAKEPTFEKETDLCAAFIASLPKGWVAYPETGGFDIVLRREADGFQIGIEAKLRLNAKVITQVAEGTSHYAVAMPGPDCRAVLIPDGVSMDLASILPLLGITAITMRFDGGNHKAGWRTSPFSPSLPTLNDSYSGSSWYERCPAKRLELPDWVPDVAAGSSAPVALTPWKVKAIKIAVLLEKRGYVTRQDFAHFQISMSRWTQEGWIKKDGNGGWIASRLPDFKAQHPVNYSQIEADFEKWKPANAMTQRGLFNAA